jgi:2-polyprenyl-3-methyl-5-hydroxy-6-metoxy-1,4-benzoquinol methylase
MLLEHVDNPVRVLKNCKLHLRKRGRIIIQVPNAESDTRQLGTLMGIIPNILDNSKREQQLYGHKRVYTKELLRKDCQKSGMDSLAIGSYFYKPLPNSMLLSLCKKQGKVWTQKFIDALMKYRWGKDGGAILLAICR